MTTTITTNGLEDGQIIKTDELGRVRTSRERREALLEEYERSGMSGAAFAQWAGIKYTTFASWTQKRRRAKKAVAPSEPPASEPQSAPANSKPLRWVEAVVDHDTKTSDVARAGLVVHLPGGARMEISDSKSATLAAEVLSQLQRASGC